MLERNCSPLDVVAEEAGCQGLIWQGGGQWQIVRRSKCHGPEKEERAPHDRVLKDDRGNNN
jgi:hypothetical protein